ncbi:hypothetical protein V1264_011920 [Littorina saxatilis]|uniref:Transposable element P transposase n=1 Tax=Littorina saxatilis TaxID=31220 RepID=A0AAN9BVR9_9CAEN
MTIRSDLMFDQRSGFLVGFVNKDSWTFDTDREKVATHALVFYVVGVNSTLKMSVGYFGTTGATSDELLPLLWTAIGCLEECGWKVVASTSDKASPNQRLYQLHQVPGVSDVCFKAVNLHAPEREVFFISDAPHLIKTVRNNLESSGKNTRLLWKDGFKLLWSHISDVREADRARGLRMTKLENAHINLTPHSKMNVSLAAQVLSNRVGRVMQTYGKPEVQETAKFVLLMDRFFDCLNTRHLKEGERKLKPDLDAYTDVNDPRFQFLEDFLQYLEDWRTSVDNRNDQPYTRADRQKMFLTHQTYRGLVMTVRAFIGVTRFLLANGVSFILSNKFCQDPIEEHFGRHRAMKRTAENPSLYEFGHQENSILLQRQLALIITPRGNSRGAHHEPPQVDLSISPLKKKKNN